VVLLTVRRTVTFALIGGAKSIAISEIATHETSRPRYREVPEQ